MSNTSSREQSGLVLFYVALWFVVWLFVIPLVSASFLVRCVITTGLVGAIYVFFRGPIRDLIRHLLGEKSGPQVIRPGERILQRHASGSAGQLGGSQLMQTADLLRLNLVRPNGDGFPHIGVIQGVPIIYPGDGHLLTVAPAGSGKSSGPVAANLLTYPGAIIATDPKGELASLTAHWRASQGVAVHVIDPWAIVPVEDIPGGARATFNPIDLIPGGWDRGQPFEGPDSIDNAHLVADAIIVEGSKSDPHWDRTAKALLSGLLLIAALDPEWRAPRTLTAVNDLLGLPADTLRLFLEGAARSPIRAAAAEINQFLSKGEKEAAGIRSTVDINMRFLQGTAMQQAFRGRLKVCDTDGAKPDRA